MAAKRSLLQSPLLKVVASTSANLSKRHVGKAHILRQGLHTTLIKDYGRVKVERVAQDGDIGRDVALLSLNTPDKFNALTVDMGEEFQAAIESLRYDCADIGAVVITGAGKAFSAGGDLEWLLERHRDSPSRNSMIMRKFYGRFLSVRSLPVPTIAAINGPAIGAGLCLAVACDIRIAKATANMGLTFVTLGIHPGMGGSHLLPTLIGHQAANQLILTGDVINGKRALELGLVAETVDGNPVDRALEIAKKMARASPLALRMSVRTLRTKQDHGLEEALWREADCQAICYQSKDFGEGIAAVAAKRPPRFDMFEEYSG